MYDLDIFFIIYFSSSFLISFLISFLYLMNYPNKNSNYKFGYYFTIICFSLTIFLSFIVIFDFVASIHKEVEGKFYNNFNDTKIYNLRYEHHLIDIFLDNVQYYYLIFGLFSKFVQFFLAPLLILYYTTGFYKKYDIFCDLIKRYIQIYINQTNIILALIAIIPVSLLYIYGTYGTVFGRFKMLLNYLNFYSNLTILFYIGFFLQNIPRNYSLKKTENDMENYIIWKLGKIFFYYSRELKNLNDGYNEIKELIEEFSKNEIEIPQDFKMNFQKFKKNIENAQRNIVKIDSNLEEVKYATKKYNKQAKEIMRQKKQEEIRKKREEKNKINNDIYEQNEEEINVELLGENNYNEINGDNNEDNNIEGEDERYYQYLKEKNEEAVKHFNEEEKINKKNCWKKCWEEKKPPFNNFIDFKNYICALMTKVNEDSLSIKRKSYLIDLKIEEIFNNKQTSCNKFCNECSIILYLFLIFIIFLLEIPIFYLNDISYIGNGLIKNPIKNYTIFIILLFIPVIIYFCIFYYSIIYHKYIQGEIIFGKNKSENTHFLKFLILVLGLNNALIFHSVWILNKINAIKTQFSETYIFYIFLIPVKYGQIDKIDIVASTGLIFIIISAICSLKFSKLKIKGHNIFIFNENIDFFIGEENFYSNFLLGCGCYINIYKNYFEKKYKLNNNNNNKANDKINDNDNDIDIDTDKKILLESVN